MLFYFLGLRIESLRIAFTANHKNFDQSDINIEVKE